MTTLDLACLAIVLLPMIAAYFLVWALCRMAAISDNDKEQK